GNVTINYEKGWWIRSARQLNPNDPEQFLHQIAPVLTTRNVTYRKGMRRKLYSIPGHFGRLRPMADLNRVNFEFRRSTAAAATQLWTGSGRYKAGAGQHRRWGQGHQPGSQTPWRDGRSRLAMRRMIVRASSWVI